MSIRKAKIIGNIAAATASLFLVVSPAFAGVGNKYTLNCLPDPSDYHSQITCSAVNNDNTPYTNVTIQYKNSYAGTMNCVAVTCASVGAGGTCQTTMPDYELGYDCNGYSGTASGSTDVRVFVDGSMDTPSFDDYIVNIGGEPPEPPPEGLTISSLYESGDLTDTLGGVLAEAGPYILALFGIALVLGVALLLIGKAKKWILSYFK